MIWQMYFVLGFVVGWFGRGLLTIMLDKSKKKDVKNGKLKQEVKE